jgi:hypothetical protein
LRHWTNFPPRSIVRYTLEPIALSVMHGKS